MNITEIPKAIDKSIVYIHRVTLSFPERFELILTCQHADNACCI